MSAEAPRGGTTVSVVIPSFGRPTGVRRCAAAFLDDGADEVVVVLDGPQPAARRELATLCDSRLRVLELDANVGLALARIVGLRVARCEIVLLADDDVEPVPGLLDRHRALHGSREKVVGVGYMPVHLAGDPALDDAATRIYAREYEETTRRWRTDSFTPPLSELWNGNVSVPRDLYLAAEAFLPSIALPYNEDLDLGLRLERCGARAVFLPDARAVHHHRRGSGGLAREATSRGRSAAALEQRWGHLPSSIDDLVHRDLTVAGRVLAVLATPTAGAAVAGAALTTLSRLLRRMRYYGGEELTLRVMRRLLAIGAYRRAWDERGRA